MKMFDIFKNTTENSTKNIGKVECDIASLTETFVKMMDKLGMMNPGSIVVSSNKAVKIVKEGDKYIMTISAFNPPLRITWTDSFNLTSLSTVIEKVCVEESKKIAYLNLSNTNTNPVCQLAIA